MRTASSAYLVCEVYTPFGAVEASFERCWYSCLRDVWYHPGVFDLPKASADHEASLAVSSSFWLAGATLYLTGAVWGRMASAAASRAVSRASRALMASLGSPYGSAGVTALRRCSSTAAGGAASAGTGTGTGAAGGIGLGARSFCSSDATHDESCCDTRDETRRDK